MNELEITLLHLLLGRIYATYTYHRTLKPLPCMSHCCQRAQSGDWLVVGILFLIEGGGGGGPLCKNRACIM